MSGPRWAAASWLRGYGRAELGSDALASLIVTVMLIPQSLAYAMLAGLPPEAGLYASMLPMVAYAMLGSSRVLAVGPVAVISLMTASALAEITAEHAVAWPVAAALLALISGAILLGLGLLRMGWIANFLSHSVISGFVSACALLIALGQCRQLLGVDGGGDTLPALVTSLSAELASPQPVVAMLGLGAMVLLVAVRSRLGPTLLGLGVAPSVASACVRAGPVLAVLAGIVAVRGFSLAEAGVPIVGPVPGGLPSLRLPSVDVELLVALTPPAALISLVGFVESISVGQSLAVRRRQRVEPNQELLGLGAANLAAGVCGGLPVTGGFSRTIVNFDAGAATPMAGVFTAAAMAAVALFLTPAFHDLPRAVLGAVIVVAVLPLVDLSAVRHAWRHGPGDFVALLSTFAGVLLLGVEPGIALGIGLSVGLHFWRTSRPHVAVVGRVPGTEHFRNVRRHAVQTHERVLSVRIDESLYFANVRYLEDRIGELLFDQPEATELVLQCSAVNSVDGSGMEFLERLSASLAPAGVRLHLSEVKGPVHDALDKARVIERLTGEVHFRHDEAVRLLSAEPHAARDELTGAGDGI